MKQLNRLWEFIPKPESKMQFGLVLAMLLLLPLLAVLQYRWLGQVSEGERAFLNANLNTAAERLSRDFNEEVTRLFIAFINDPFDQPESVTSAQRPESFDVITNYVKGFRNWQATSTHPHWVKGIYFVQFDSNQTPNGEALSLRCFEQASESVAACQWPAELREFGQQSENNLIQMRRTMMAGSPPQPNRMPQGLFGQIPAMLIPLRIGSPGATPFQMQPNRRNGNNANLSVFAQRMDWRQLGFLLVHFDQRYLSETVLPALVREHFASETNDYDIAIVSRNDKPQLIYSTSPHPPQASNSDVAIPLFGIQSQLVRRVFLDRMRAREGFSVARPVNEAPRKPSIRSMPAPFIMGMAEGSNSVEGGQWQLLIRHRAGSLAAAVGQARRRNIIISFGILLLLSTSLVFLLSSMRKSQRLAQAQMDFVAGVSHELRTPLSVIDAAGYNLTKGHIKDPEQIAKYGGMIRQESRRLIEMVEQILEFAGAQSKQPQYDLQPVNLRTIIDATCATVPMAGGDFKIAQEFEKDLPPIYADATALQRAFQNLITNAMKYSGDSRRVELVAQRNPLRQAIDIQVRDQGLGIPSAELPYIFEPFYRGKEVRAAQIHGNGLGLSLVKKIVEAHGGQISVRSEEGRGSTFTVSLPIQTV